MAPAENYTSITVCPVQNLSGSVAVPGDKVAAVHLSFATILSGMPTIIQNSHECADVLRIQNWIESSGIASIAREGSTVAIVPHKQEPWESFDLTELSDTRGNICLATPLALRGIPVQFSGTAGCGFTRRGVDKHFELMETFGLIIDETNGSFKITSEEKADDIHFDCATNAGIPSVGVTCHALMAGLSYKGKISLTHCALEAAPATLLAFVEQVTGRTIHTNGTTITLEAVESIHHKSAIMTLPPDTTVAATYIAAVTATGGSIELQNVTTNHFPKSLLNVYKEIGLIIASHRTSMTITAIKQNLKQPSAMHCDVWPGIPTDIAPILAASLAGIPGTTTIVDAIYDTRASHIQGLNDMGYSIGAEGNQVTINGGTPKTLEDITIEAADIRAGAAVLVGALGSNVKSIQINEYRQINRGYADVLKNLKNIGATITAERD